MAPLHGYCDGCKRAWWASRTTIVTQNTPHNTLSSEFFFMVSISQRPALLTMLFTRNAGNGGQFILKMEGSSNHRSCMRISLRVKNDRQTIFPCTDDDHLGVW